jgi:hypothetical protein
MAHLVVGMAFGFFSGKNSEAANIRFQQIKLWL